MNNDFQSKAEEKMNALEHWMAPLFAKAPHLPQNAKETVAQAAPWLALIFGVLGLFGILSAGGMATMFAFSYMFAGVSYFSLYLALIIGLLASILDLLAYKPLTTRRKKGWNYLFYGAVLSFISAILNMVFGYASVGAILGPIVGFWLLFEVRSLYH